jgi:two-component system, chemotaxis family, chemotaxis protein CheY
LQGFSFCAACTVAPYRKGPPLCSQAGNAGIVFSKHERRLDSHAMWVVFRAVCGRSLNMGKRILTVDDSASILQVEKMVLSGAGYEVVQASDGQDAVDKLKGIAVHLVLTDLNMPRLDGVGLIRAIRANASHRLTPVIMVTTESKDEKKQEGKAAGATGWIVKPFTPEQLLAVVKKVIG